MWDTHIWHENYCIHPSIFFWRTLLLGIDAFETIGLQLVQCVLVTMLHWIMYWVDWYCISTVATTLIYIYMCLVHYLQVPALISSLLFWGFSLGSKLHGASYQQTGFTPVITCPFIIAPTAYNHKVLCSLAALKQVSILWNWMGMAYEWLCGIYRIPGLREWLV